MILACSGGKQVLQVSVEQILEQYLISFKGGNQEFILNIPFNVI